MAARRSLMERAGRPRAPAARVARRVWVVATLTLALLLGPLHAALAGETPEPLPAVNLNPLHLLLLQPPAQAPAPASRVGFALGYATIMVSEERGEDSALLDMEVARASLRLARALPGGQEIWAELPFLWFGGGAFDALLVGYHDALQVSDGGRSERPRNAFAYAVHRDGEVYSPDPPRGGGLGDAMVGAKFPLLRPSPGRGEVAWRATAKLPTGSPARGFGSGRMDAGAGVVASWTAERLWLLGNLDGLFFGGTPHAALRLGTPWALAALAEGGWQLGALGTVSAGLRYVTSPFKTGFSAPDRDVLMLQAGYQRALSPSLRAHLGFTEDLAVQSSPDFCLFLGLEWSGTP